MVCVLREKGIGRHDEGWVTLRVDWPRLAGLVIGVYSRQQQQEAACLSYYRV